jgi:hypothetical protein
VRPMANGGVASPHRVDPRIAIHLHRNLTCTISQPPQIEDQIFLGHLGTDELAAAALGKALVTWTRYCVVGTPAALRLG